MSDKLTLIGEQAAKDLVAERNRLAAENAELKKDADFQRERADGYSGWITVFEKRLAIAQTALEFYAIPPTHYSEKAREALREIKK